MSIGRNTDQKNATSFLFLLFFRCIKKSLFFSKIKYAFLGDIRIKQKTILNEKILFTLRSVLPIRMQRDILYLYLRLCLLNKFFYINYTLTSRQNFGYFRLDCCNLEGKKYRENNLYKVGRNDKRGMDIS